MPPKRKQPELDLSTVDNDDKIPAETWVSPLFADKDPPILAKDIHKIRVFQIGKGVRQKQLDWSKIIFEDEGEEWEVNPWTTDDPELRKHLPPGRYTVDALRKGTGHVIPGSSITLTVDETDTQAQWEDDLEDGEEETDGQVSGPQLVAVPPPQPQESAISELLRQTQARQAEMEKRLMEMAQQRTEDAVRHARELSEAAMKASERHNGLTADFMTQIHTLATGRRGDGDALVEELRRDNADMRSRWREEVEKEREDKRQEIRSRDKQIDELNRAVRDALSKNATDIESMARKHDQQLTKMLDEHRLAMTKMAADHEDAIRERRREYDEDRRRREKDFEDERQMLRKRILELETQLLMMGKQSVEEFSKMSKDQIELERRIAKSKGDDSGVLQQALGNAVGAAADFASGFKAKNEADARRIEAERMAMAQQMEAQRAMAARAEAMRQQAVRSQPQAPQPEPQRQAVVPPPPMPQESPSPPPPQPDAAHHAQPEPPPEIKLEDVQTFGPEQAAS